MYRHHLPLIAVLALAGACADTSDSPSPSALVLREAALTGQQAPAAQTAFKGIYQLEGPTLALKTIDDIKDKSFIEGVALRTGWTALDTGKTGPSYDFAPVIDAIAQLQAVGKKLSLGIDAQIVPQYVVDAAQTTYITTVPGPGSETYPMETPVTWDQPSLTSYAAFMTSLANTLVCKVGSTCARKDKVPLKDHPTLAALRINILGMGKLRQSTGSAIFEVPTYRRQTFINAVKTNIHAAHDQFKSITSWIPYFSVNDSASGTNQTPTLDDALLAAITTEFNGSSDLRPTIGFFQELLRGDSPNNTGSMGANLIKARTLGGFTVFQACGGWTNQTLCTFASGDTTPENGFDLGYGTYGAQYYELYTGDLSNSALTSMFTKWSPFVKDPASAANPVGLVATPGTSATKNILSWTDTSTIETNWIVERKTLPSGDWEVRATLAADTTTYRDDATRNTSYAYRVHAIGAGGPFVLSNEPTVAGR